MICAVSRAIIRELSLLIRTHAQPLVYNVSASVSSKALGHDYSKNNGLILKIGVLSSNVINGYLYHIVFAGFRYLSMYIKALYTFIYPKI